ncbi:MAG: cupin domain-containing protein [Gemmatimonadota bacterium]
MERPPTASEVIELLGLEPHPEEGVYLLTPGTRSAMHRLPGDEVLHFYLGDPVEMLELMADGRSRATILGPALDRMTVQHVVPGGTWQGSRLVPGGAWALLGTTMAPGFSYDDYEAGSAELATLHPGRAELIEVLLPDAGAP